MKKLLILMTLVAFFSCNKDNIVGDAGEDDSPVTPATPESPLKVYEYRPAPGQFIGEAAMSDISTPEAAAEWARKRLESNLYVSLGGFGGYVIAGFGGSIRASAQEYDFYISGNAFLNASTGTGGSNEPGIVYVMQDENRNGLPDDGKWYELRGSDTFASETVRNYAVTYHRPGEGESVKWTDNRGNSGEVPRNPFHTQSSYYPAWIQDDTYTLSGTCLAAKTVTENGIWSNYPFAWGYADNMGSDTSVSASGLQTTGFSISNAIDSEGKGVTLKYIDFIKIQTGVNSTSGILGEVSTEVTGITLN